MQKSILEIAAETYTIGKEDVLEGYYRFIPVDKLTSRQWNTAFKEVRRKNYPTASFVQWDVNEGRYLPVYAESERVATGRAFRRLEKRGFLQEKWGYWQITDAGRKEVNGSVTNVPKPLA